MKTKTESTKTEKPVVERKTATLRVSERKTRDNLSRCMAMIK